MKKRWDNFAVSQSKQNSIQENISNDKNNKEKEYKINKKVVKNNKEKEKPEAKKEQFFPLFHSEEKFEEAKKGENNKKIESIKEFNCNEKNNLNNNTINITNNEMNINNSNININNNGMNINNKNNLYNNENENTYRENNYIKDIQNIKVNSPLEKNIDYENSTIKKVFNITLDEDDKNNYLYLELYLAKILSLDQTPSFKLENLDDIILNIMIEETIKNNLIDYFLDCFHRAYEIIEDRFKEVLGASFSQIHQTIISYFGQMVIAPESFSLNMTKKEISQKINNYFIKTNDDELICLFEDIEFNYRDDIVSMSQILIYLFAIIQKENLDNQTFFKDFATRKNLNLLNKIFENCQKIGKVFLNDYLFNPKVLDGRIIQFTSFLGPYLSNCPFEAPIDQIRNSFKQFTNDTELKSYTNKLNNIIQLISNVVINLIEIDEEKALNYFFQLSI